MWKNSRGTSFVSICSIQGWRWTRSHLCFPFPRVHPLYSSSFSVPPPPDGHSQSWVSDTASHFWLRRLGCPSVVLWPDCLPSGNASCLFFVIIRPIPSLWRCGSDITSAELLLLWGSLDLGYQWTQLAINPFSFTSRCVLPGQRQSLVLASVAGLGSARLRVCMLAGHLLTEN